MKSRLQKMRSAPLFTARRRPSHSNHPRRKYSKRESKLSTSCVRSLKVARSDSLEEPVWARLSSSRNLSETLHPNTEAIRCLPESENEPAKGMTCTGTWENTKFLRIPGS